jgi:hypothetical protein
VNDDLEIELEGLGVDAARRERAERGPSPVGQQELVAVPGRYDELVRSGRWQQQPHARRRLRDNETFEVARPT